MIPTSFPSRSTIGTPLILKRIISAFASRSVASGASVIGFRIIPLSLRFTRSTSAACRSIDMFLWITPIPPERAIAIAISLSVTVSIAAATSGTLSEMPVVKRDDVFTSRGCVPECLGTSRTSSKVSALSARTRIPAGSAAWIRESPLSAAAEGAGRDLERELVAMGKGRRGGRARKGTGLGGSAARARRLLTTKALLKALPDPARDEERCGGDR